MRIDITASFSGIANAIQSMDRQQRFAAAVALTRTAQQAKVALVDEMRATFDRPTRFTLNSFRVKPATKDRLETFVWLKDEAFKGTPADVYLGPQIDGGTRKMKKFEQALQGAHLMPRGTFAVPGAGAQLDSFGNVKRGQIVQILSQLRAQRTGGYDSGATDSKRSKRTVARQGVIYMALPKRYKGLAAGIWAKIEFAHGKSVKPVFLFVSSANYKPIFKFREIATDVAEKNLEKNFDAALAQALATAR